MKPLDPQTVLITGATSGIGLALSLAYAVPGRTLILHGRTPCALEDAASLCRERGATVHTRALDLRDVGELQRWADDAARESPIDLVIANAGVSLHVAMDGTGEPWDGIEDVVRVNILSTIALAQAVAPAMRARGRGQIAIVSSLAAWHGLATMPTYCASKAAVKVYAEGLRAWLAPDGVGVTVILPGFVESRMSRQTFGPKPFLMTAERAALTIQRRLRANPARIAFPQPLRFSNWCLGALPPEVSRWVLRRLGFDAPRAISPSV